MSTQFPLLCKKKPITGVARQNIPDSKVHGANMSPTWVLSAPDGPHIGPMNLTIRDVYKAETIQWCSSNDNDLIDGLIELTACFIDHSMDWLADYFLTAFM